MNEADQRKVYYAAKENDVATLERLFGVTGKVDPSIRPYGQSLLLHAAFEGAVDAARWLIEHGADPDDGDAAGYTPLHGAAQWNRVEVTKLLLARGANPNASDRKGNTPLSIAVFEAQPGDHALVRALLAGGADPRREDPYKQTPIALAEKFGKKDVAALLRESSPPA